MDNLQQLLNEIECITLADISAIPKPIQHVIVERLEQLQDELKVALRMNDEYE